MDLTGTLFLLEDSYANGTNDSIIVPMHHWIEMLCVKDKSGAEIKHACYEEKDLIWTLNKF